MEHITEEWISKEKVRLTNEIDRLAKIINETKQEKEISESLLHNYSCRTLQEIIWNEEDQKRLEERFNSLENY